MTELDENKFEDVEDEEIDYRYDITSYGADYPVDSIVKRINDDVIFVPSFQRKFVWNISQASKFIESLVLGLPVPGIFLGKESSTGKLLIIDGQQRLLTLKCFYDGIFKGREFVLSGLKSDLNGRTFKTLEPSDKIRLNDSIIHATIVKQDQPNDEESSIYLIFERLNSGGNLLTAQEIRACIYYGQFNELINDLTKLTDWRLIFGKPNERMKEHEMILRFFALYYERSNYSKPLKEFLNKFMSRNRDFQRYSLKELQELFISTTKIFSDAIGNKSFRIGGPINVAAYDALMIGVSERLKSGPIDLNKFRDKYYALIEDNEFIDNTKGGTSDENSVSNRIKLALNQFQKV